MTDETLSREELLTAIRALATEIDAAVEVLYEVGGVREITLCTHCGTQSLGAHKYTHPHTSDCRVGLQVRTHYKLVKQLDQKDHP